MCRASRKHYRLQLSQQSRRSLTRACSVLRPRVRVSEAHTRSRRFLQLRGAALRRDAVGDRGRSTLTLPAPSCCGTMPRPPCSVTTLRRLSVSLSIGSFPSTTQKAPWSAFEAAMTSGVMRLQGRPTLTRAKHQSGRRVYVEMTFALVRRPMSAARGAVAVARDVTERIEQHGPVRDRSGVQGASDG